jgi:hypothetical protein
MMEEDMISFVIYSVQCNNYGSTSSPPQSVGLAARFPQLDSTILATSPVELTIGGEADRPDRAMVTLLNLCRRKLA